MTCASWRVYLARELGDAQAERMHTDAFVASRPDCQVDLWISAIAPR